MSERYQGYSLNVILIVNAFSPDSHVQIIFLYLTGGCTSLCGSGPIVEVCDHIDDVQSTKRKRV